MTPQVSVIITSLNRPNYLRAACASVLSQDFDNIEVMICDDASDDISAREAATSIAASDTRVRVIQNDTRMGQYHTVVKATETMRGRYFAILNDDDTWEPGFLSALIAPLERDNSLVASFCDHYIMDVTGSVNPTSSDKNTRACHRDTLSPGKHHNGSYLAFGLSAFPTVVASLFRTSAVDWNRYRTARLDVTGLYDLWLQCCLFGRTSAVWYDPRRLSRYRVHSGQLSGKPNVGLARAKTWIWEEALDAGDMSVVELDILRQLSRAHHALGVAYLRRGQLPTARSYLWRACAHSPRRRSVVGLLLASGLSLTPPIRKRLVR